MQDPQKGKRRKERGRVRYGAHQANRPQINGRHGSTQNAGCRGGEKSTRGTETNSGQAASPQPRSPGGGEEGEADNQKGCVSRGLLVNVFMMIGPCEHFAPAVVRPNS